MVPVLSQTFSSSTSSLASTVSGSVQSLADLIVTASASRLADNNVEVVREEGLQHAKVKLDAR